MYSCDRLPEKYCVYNTHWDKLDTCVDLKLLNAFIKDYCIIDTNRFDKNYRFSLKLIQDTLRSDNEDIAYFYVDSLNKLNDSVLFVSIKHKDSYLYDYVLHGGIPPVVGNISVKDRYFKIDLIEKKLLEAYFYQ
jgi:hypothetical protein